jgi:hypothetical protein
MLAFVFTIIGVSFNETIRAGFTKALVFLGLPLPANTIHALLPASLILLYVLTAESWIWFKRLELTFTLRAIRKLRERFTLKPVR